MPRGDSRTTAKKEKDKSHSIRLHAENIIQIDGTQVINVLDSHVQFFPIVVGTSVTAVGRAAAFPAQIEDVVKVNIEMNVRLKKPGYLTIPDLALTLASHRDHDTPSVPILTECTFSQDYRVLWKKLEISAHPEIKAIGFNYMKTEEPSVTSNVFELQFMDLTVIKQHEDPAVLEHHLATNSTLEDCLNV
ncbi:hypothetical protein L210DRAFT_3507778 [Boletus edulis BED1]|uniref:Uncharacterized protein n=1 Tax=Boletus edulis BED1 TaxID=1328754 RepID=A0AAD4BIR0_BOLED|nr:hypothetical protein L210DRAFT_3507778 [Boletus edulis BED1]